MRYLIVGCGRVGSTLAKRLARDGHDVTVVDENSAAFRRVGRDFPGKLVLGTGIDVDVLRRAGAETSDGFAAVTQGDNRNIMAALIAQQHFKIPRVVARIYDPERSSMYRDFGISTVCPTTVGARLMGGALMEDQFSSLLFDQADAEIVEQTVGAVAAGKMVRDITQADKGQIALIVRANHSIIPGPEIVFEAGDRVVGIVRPEFVGEFRRRLGDSKAVAV
ncbi:MAG: TrkA family potassium uptake protein [Candidatus Eremiobacteraeota bacterium]|nr:TrkA family potassium uptake protein [Candidatus Eremiobacteraeota bacterium]MBV8263424.1 TrkA family potassium uptake protein [Candidatus Eremiobacteraeota bacterium]MBV8459972.1 TrkA family potassium uptake protein [Candidatus Eremiobacteraeota bacterium]MBV8596328.1 TrkA family potassium uptake protein [Candidatus Eremiobacteraeota bacterium]MBV8669014.1 TrkA family potassium uptake protein [Candidatus Eremiobacteraeota bacterium]